MTGLIQVGYLCGIDCTSSWRRLDEWDEGKRLDQQKIRLAPLEPGKVTINEEEAAQVVNKINYSIYKYNYNCYKFL